MSRPASHPSVDSADAFGDAAAGSREATVEASNYSGNVDGMAEHSDSSGQLS